ncbi:MAG: DUF4388 domain-containing protein, partial [Nitriliruptoraceae bacterium]|nr:DUF4388 domain-containing protein [Nitriliruptoraceae bacterium]
MATICRHVSAEGRSGTLTVSGLDGPGSISFADGRIVAARSPVAGARLGDRLVGAGFLSEPDLRRVLDDQQREGSRARLGALLVERRLVTRDAIRLFLQEQTLDSLLELVRWRFGTYRFEDADPAADSDQTAVPVAMPVDDVLLVVGQRQREWMELSRVIPDLAAVPTFTAATTTVSATLEPDEFAVLASVDGERDLHQLAEDLGYHEFELARIVYGLTQLGVVDVLLPEDEVGAALDAALHPDHAPPPAATVRASLAERWRAEGPDGAVDAPAAAQEPADSEPGDPEPGDAEPAASEPGDAEPGDAEPREAPA